MGTLLPSAVGFWQDNLHRKWHRLFRHLLRWVLIVVTIAGVFFAAFFNCWLSVGRMEIGLFESVLCLLYRWLDLLSSPPLITILSFFSAILLFICLQHQRAWARSASTAWPRGTLQATQAAISRSDETSGSHHAETAHSS